MSKGTKNEHRIASYVVYSMHVMYLILLSFYQQKYRKKVGVFRLHLLESYLLYQVIVRSDFHEKVHLVATFIGFEPSYGVF